MSNRVEELESQVAELQAAVDGLTEELVETRERLRQLEADSGVEVQTSAPAARTPEVADEPADGTELVDEAAADEAAADEAKSPESEASDEPTESEPASESETESDLEESDIIVA
jgi:hypothetical protein